MFMAHPLAQSASAPRIGRRVVLLAAGREAAIGPLPALLTRLGYAARLLADAAELPALLRRHRNDANAPIVLLDLDAAAGADLPALLRLVAGALPDAEVLLLAARRDRDRAVDALALGAAEVLAKPLDSRLLAHRLAHAARRIAEARLLRETTATAELAAGRAEAEAADERANLARSLRRHRDLFDTVPCAITVQDRDLTILEANRTFLREFCRTPRGCAVIGSRCHEAYKHRTEPCPDCPILDTFADGERHQAETVVTDREGRARNILIWTAPILDAAGRVEKVMEVSTDITKIRRLQDHLSSLGMMLGSMSHGVKGLITGLDGGMYRVESGLRRNDPEKIRSGWSVVRRRIEAIRKMVLDVLYYAKSREPDLSRVDLKTFAEELAMLVEPRAAAGNIRFVRDFSSARGFLTADVSALSSALVNILDNAVDACLCETTGRPRRIVFSVEADGPAGRVAFTVSDTGVGMDEETREKMFTLFFSSKGGKGTGLGLFIASQVFAQHRGGVEAFSDMDRGTTLRAWIPLVQPDGDDTPIA